MFGWFKRKPPAQGPGRGPDFSAVDSVAKADAMARRGELEKLFLMPLEFGGTNNPLNTLYVPVGTAGIKSGIDNNVIGPLADAGKVSKYQASPEYQGKSVIPIAVRIVASGETEFRTEINIWGEALTRPSKT